MKVKLTNRQVNKFLEEIVGRDAVLVLKACDLKKGTTDEGIAKKTKFTLPKIRSLLNQLHYRGLIRYDREKNIETNWYTYTWFANMETITEVVSGRWESKLEELQKQLDYESKYIFYSCGNGCAKLPFELATEYDFNCPDCGKGLDVTDNKVAVREALQEIKEVRALMKQLS